MCERGPKILSRVQYLLHVLNLEVLTAMPTDGAVDLVMRVRKVVHSFCKALESMAALL